MSHPNPQFFPELKTPGDAAKYLNLLASWWLPADWRAVAGVAPPAAALPQGGLVALCTWSERFLPPWVTTCSKGQPRKQQNLAFLLPLQWVKGENHSHRLPLGFAKCADQALQAARRMKLKDFDEHWRLELAPSIAPSDLQAITLSGDSVLTSLVAALCLAHHGAQPAPRVFATGDVDDDGRVQSVDNVAAKTQLVCELSEAWGEKVTLFVPWQNLEEAQGEQKSSRLKLAPYPIQQDRADLPHALQEHLAQLDAPPGEHAGLDEHIAWANRDHIARDRRRRGTHYLEYIVTPLAARIRDSYEQGQTAPAASTAEKSSGYRLAVSTGLTPPVTALSILLHAKTAQEVCLLTTTESAERLEQSLAPVRKEYPALKIVEVRLEKAARPTSPSALTTDSVIVKTRAEAVEALQAWLSGASTARVDITPGNSALSAMIIAAAQRAGSKVFYLRHETGEHHGHPLFGTERLERLPWVESGA